MYIDEGPSEEDLQRFRDESGYCPKCGNEIWDSAEVCPQCGDYIGGQVSSRDPGKRNRRQQLVVIIAIIVLIAFLLVAVF